VSSRREKVKIVLLDRCNIGNPALRNAKIIQKDFVKNNDVTMKSQDMKFHYWF